MNLKESLRYYTGIALVIFGLIMITGGLVQYNEGKESFGSVISLVFFIGIIPLVSGGYLTLSAARRAKTRKSEARFKELLQLARQHKGFLTVAMVATSTSYSITEAEQLLSELQVKGFFELHLSPEGVMVYRLPGFLQDSDHERLERL